MGTLMTNNELKKYIVISKDLSEKYGNFVVVAEIAEWPDATQLAKSSQAPSTIVGIYELKATVDVVLRMAP